MQSCLYCCISTDYIPYHFPFSTCHTAHSAGELSQNAFSNTLNKHYVFVTVLLLFLLFMPTRALHCSHNATCDLNTLLISRVTSDLCVLGFFCSLSLYKYIHGRAIIAQLLLLHSCVASHIVLLFMDCVL